MSTHDDPLDRFIAEHDEALAALERLEEAAEALQAGDRAPEHLRTAKQVHSFLSTTVREHNENEERALFPMLGDRAPTEVFVDEHVDLRAAEEELRSAIEAGDRGETASAAFDIIDLLRTHIDRENEVLFPTARELLGADGLAEVSRRLDEIDS